MLQIERVGSLNNIINFVAVRRLLRKKSKTTATTDLPNVFPRWKKGRDWFPMWRMVRWSNRRCATFSIVFIIIVFAFDVCLFRLCAMNLALRYIPLSQDLPLQDLEIAQHFFGRVALIGSALNER